MNKSKKKEKSNSASRQLNRFGVLLEHMDGKIDTVAEQYGDIKKDIHGIKETLSTHTEMIGNLAVNVVVVKEDIEVIKTDVRVLKADMQEAKQDIGVIKEDVKTTKHVVGVMKQDIGKKVNIEESALLERRVAALEKHR